MFDLKHRAQYAFEACTLPITIGMLNTLKIAGKNGQIIFGLGSGRSGTQSLAKLLNQQPSSKVWHEKEKWRIPWVGGEKKVIHQIQLFKFLSRFYHLVGDISFYYLPYVPLIKQHIPNVKFICLRRNKEDTIKSYAKWVSRQNFCPWIDHDGRKWSPNHWDHCYPKYDTDNMEEAISMYYNEYYETAIRYEQSMPEHFKIFWIDALNTEEGQREIFEFIGITNPILRVGIRTNQLLSENT